MVDHYYDLMGWEVESGKPRQETVDQFGLANFVEHLGSQSRPEAPASAG